MLKSSLFGRDRAAEESNKENQPPVTPSARSSIFSSSGGTPPSSLFKSKIAGANTASPLVPKRLVLGSPSDGRADTPVPKSRVSEERHAQPPAATPEAHSTSLFKSMLLKPTPGETRSKRPRDAPSSAPTSKYVEHVLCSASQSHSGLDHETCAVSRRIRQASEQRRLSAPASSSRPQTLSWLCRLLRGILQARWTPA